MTIAGTDSGGGAGVVADVKTFEAHDVWATVAIAAVTAQNTLGVQAAEALPADLVRDQIESVVSDIGVDAAKTGMLATAGIVSAVVSAVRDLDVGPLVVDPVIVSSTGAVLLSDEAVGVVREQLVPLATVVTPNMAEAREITGLAVDDRAGMERAARALVDLGARVALVTGGHLEGDEAADCLVQSGVGEAVWLAGARIPSRHVHGTGCVLAAAITAELARGMDPADACVAAKHFVERAIAAGPELGRGVGPVDPGWERRAG